MATIPLPHVWNEFLRLMISNDVRYMLVGGIAVGYYGYPRGAGGIHFWVDNTLDNERAVTATLQAFEIRPSDTFFKAFRKLGKVIRLGCPPLRIELLTGMEGLIFQACYARRGKARFDDTEADIISLEDLKVNMRARGRANDMDNLANLP